MGHGDGSFPLSKYQDTLKQPLSRDSSRQRRQAFLVGALTHVGIARSTLPPHPHPHPVCRVAAERLFLVLISEQIAVLWEQHAVRAPSTVPGTK